MKSLLFDNEGVYYDVIVLGVAARRRLTACKGGLLARGNNEGPK